MSKLIKFFFVVIMVVYPLFNTFADTRLTFEELRLIYPVTTWGAVAGLTYEILDNGEDYVLIEIDGEVYLIQS